ncbi:MAG: metallophosphoesterase [Chloroflexi bacterium]|nr:metallophosphoesterase [Chloroflexota bacterium]
MAERITRRQLLMAAGPGLLGGAVALAGGYGYATHVEPGWLAVERVRVPLASLPPALEGLTVALMSDLHLGRYTPLDRIVRAVRVVNCLAPDLVLLGGDYVLHSAELIHALAPALAELSPRLGIYAALGNHDLWTDAETIRGGLEGVGIPVLVNEGRLLGAGGEGLYVAGLDDGWSGLPDLDRALADCPAGCLVLLLMHEPDWADRWAGDERVALQLSGHSHGGQVRLPGIGAPVLPLYGRKYDAGLYRVGAMWLYTTRGIGVIGPPVRLACRPEITEITLTREA